MIDDYSDSPSEWLHPLAGKVDEVLALYEYRITPAIEAINAAIPGLGGLFATQTTNAELHSALDQIISAEQPPVDDHPNSANPSTIILYVDGSCHGNPGPAGAGAVLQADGETLARLGRPVGSNTGNNVAEYAALYLGLGAITTWYHPDTVEVRTDSMTVVKDVWKGKSPADRFSEYSSGITALLSQLSAADWTHLSDSEPNPADARATVGADIAGLGP